LFHLAELAEDFNFSLNQTTTLKRGRTHLPMSSSLYAMQHIKKMRGGSQAHLLRVSDGGFYVTKLVGNPQHTRVFANEMLASRLGQWLGHHLTSPTFKDLATPSQRSKRLNP
jgi:hypothetical protein